MKLSKITAAMGLAVGMAVGGTAAAAPTYFGFTLFEDDLFDFHVDNDGDGLISVGDRIITVLEVGTTAPVLGGAPSTAITPPEFTAVLDSFVATDSGPQGLSGFHDFTFAPNPNGFLVDGLAASGISAATAAQASAGGAGLIGGEMIRFFDGPVANLDLIGNNCTSIDDCVSRATDGTFYFSAGFAGDADELFLLADVPNDPTVVANIPAGTSLGNGQFAFSFIDNQSGKQFNPISCAPFCGAGGDNMIDVAGSGSIEGGLGLPASNGAFARGDFQFRVDAVPVPAPLALLGLGMLALANARRRKNLA